MYKEKDIVQILEKAPYTITRPGTKWMVYSSDGVAVRVGPVAGTDEEFAALARCARRPNARVPDELMREFPSTRGVRFYRIETLYVEKVDRLAAGLNKNFTNLLSPSLEQVGKPTPKPTPKKKRTGYRRRPAGLGEWDSF